MNSEPVPDEPTRTWHPSAEGETLTMPPGAPLAEGADIPALRMDDLNARLEGQYRIRDIIGSGGMGTVYLAQDLKLQREVSIKALHATRARRSGMTRLLREEAMLVASLTHPHIKQVYDVLEVEGRPLIVMEYVEGSNLEEVVRAGKIEPAALVEVMIAVCDAVGFAHSHAVIHRDIKPSNIILTRDGVPKLADFGIAVRMDSEKGPGGDAARFLPGRIVGSPAFMAPEQARGQLSEMDSGTDIYALGATLYFGLTGKAPFRGTPAEIIEQVLAGQVLPPSRFAAVPGDLEAICMQCLQAQPADRYRTAYALADDLRAYLEARPLKARRYGFLERARRSIARRPNTFALAVLASMIMFGATFLSQYVLYRDARDTVLRALRERVIGIAHTGAMLISPSYVKAITSQADRDAPACRTLVSILKELKRRNPDLQRVFLVRDSRVPGYVEFVADDALFDSDEELDLDDDGVVSPAETPVVIGQLYTDSPERPQLRRGFRTPVAEERSEAFGRHLTLSGYAPVFDVDGDSVAVVWVRMRTEKIDESFALIDGSFRRAVALLAVLFLALVTLILLWTIGLWERPPAAPRGRRLFRFRLRGAS